MKNLDTLQAQKIEIMQRMSDAVKAGDTEAFSQAFNDFAEMIQEQVMAEARGLIQAADSTILASRGVRQLTSQETEYYQRVIDAMKGSSPKQALSGTDYVMPETIIDTIFEDLKAAHPLLEVINFQNTGALIKILSSTSSGVAGWGNLGDEITDELAAAFAEIELTQKKLSAFIPVSKYMLELGPVWLDRYVREILMEAAAVELEAAIVDSDGKDAPLGMTRALTGAVDGVYPRKSEIVITDLDPSTFGGILNTISQGPNSKRRAVTGIIMVVNPQDYFTKVFPATTVRTTNGSFTTDVFPFPTRVIQSPAVPANKAIFGLPKRYMMALGTSQGGKIEYSDEYKFLEDVRVYLIKLYGNGRPMDANAFVYADISGLIPYVRQVYVTNDPLSVYPLSDARLASLAIGSLTLSPAFNKSVFYYEVDTANATNTITVVPKDGEATVEILNGGTPVANGAAATWATGENTVTITVTSGDETETYTVIVTKSE